VTLRRKVGFGGGARQAWSRWRSWLSIRAMMSERPGCWAKRPGGRGDLALTASFAWPPRCGGRWTGRLPVHGEV